MSLNARKLRWILLAVLLLLFIGGSYGFYYVYSQLTAYNKSTAELSAQADLTDSKIKRIEEAYTFLKNHKKSEERAKTIAATTDGYQYQDEIIKNIRDLAASSKLTVKTIEFTDDSSATSAATPQTLAKKSPSESIPGFTIKKATVSFAPTSLAANPSYQQILDFMYKIENNDLKMHISSLRLSSLGIGSRDIEMSNLTIGVYVKQENKK